MRHPARWKGRWILGEPPWCSPPLPCAPGWAKVPFKLYQSTLGECGPRPIAQSHGWWGGNCVAACLLNTSWNAAWSDGIACFLRGSGLSTRVELAWRPEGSTGGTVTLEMQFWKPDSLHHRILLEPHLTSRECYESQGHPRMMSTMGPSSIRKEMVSGWKHPTCRVTGGDPYLIRQRGFPCMVSILSSWACGVGRDVLKGFGRWNSLRGLSPQGRIL